MFLFLLIWDEKKYMLNVGKITANIGRNAKGIAKKAVAGAQGTLAGAAGASLPKVTGDIYKDGLNQTMGKFGKILSKLNADEYMNILVTAFGTAVVAPIFIAFNPLSKKDKETKMYSALRQPISAAIAVAAQMSVVKALNDALDKYASTGVVDIMDLRDEQQASYLKKLIKMEDPDFIKHAKAKPEYAGFTTKQIWKAEIKKRQDATFAEAIKRETEKFDLDKIATKDILTKENAISVKDYTNKVKDLKAAGKYNKNAKDSIIGEIFEDITKGIKEEAEKLFKEGKYASFDEAERALTIKKYVSAKIAKAGDVLKSNKSYLGIALGLATLPATCGILNWAYPRIVEKFFPSLANSKKESEAKKAEAQAQPPAQKTEEEDD